MIVAPLPEFEDERLAVLQSLAVLDTPPEQRFDHVTRLARRVFGVPMALVSLVDADRQWFKSRDGLEATQTARDISFCGHAILQEEVMVVDDATLDLRFHDNPLVTGQPHIRFYAGCPLKVPTGHKVGTLCILDTRQRSLNDDDLALLRDLAQMVSQDLASAQIASEDALTGLMNRRGFDQLAPRVLEACRHAGHELGLVYFDLNGFKRINDTFGHGEGDRALRTFAGVLRRAFRKDDVVARLGGDEFVALLPSAGQAQAAGVVERVATLLRAEVESTALPYTIEASAGFAAFDARVHAGLPDLLAQADHTMFALKPRGSR